MSVRSRVSALVSAREEGTSLALFRLATGLVVLWFTADVLLDGAGQLIWFDRAHGGFRGLGVPWQLEIFGGSKSRAVWMLIAASLSSAAALAAGLGGRVTAFVALQGWLGLGAIYPDAGGSYDPLVSNALWLLVLADGSATLSVDCRLRTGRWTSSRPVASWPRWLAIYQLVLVYASTGLQKVSATWTPAGGFSAVYYILQQPTWQRFDMRWVAWVYPLSQLLTAMTWLWEISSPLLLVVLWLRATAERGGRLRALANRTDLRVPYAIIGAGLHLSIAALMDVGPFSWMMLSFYLCLLEPGDWQRLRARLAGPRSSDAPAGPERGEALADQVVGAAVEAPGVGGLHHE